MPASELRAPAGTPTGTVWIWLIAILPVIQALPTIPLLARMGDVMRTVGAGVDPSGTPMSDEATRQIVFASLDLVVPALWLTLIAYLLTGAAVLFGGLDWRELRRRGVPKPFHWAWGFFAFTGAGVLVYLIGRSVVVRRRTGSGLAPLWTGVAVNVVLAIASAAWATYFFVATVKELSGR